MKNNLLDTDKFWSTIENSRLKSDGSLEEFTKLLYDELSTWSHIDLYQFQMVYEEYEIAVVLHANNLIWSALIIVNGGYCTNTYGFAGWLIANGKETYLKTLKNADFLAKTNAEKDMCNFEGIRFMAIQLAKSKLKGKIRETIKELEQVYHTPEYKKARSGLTAEIEYGNLKRNRDWTLNEMEPFLPALHQKHVKKKKFWNIF